MGLLQRLISFATFLILFFLINDLHVEQKLNINNASEVDVVSSIARLGCELFACQPDPASVRSVAIATRFLDLT
jgi:hypothetical protein